MNPSDWIKIEIEIQKQGLQGRNHFPKCIRWCLEEFGNRWDVHYREGQWCCFWSGPNKHNYYRFHFRDESDAVLFALRWS